MALYAFDGTWNRRDRRDADLSVRRVQWRAGDSIGRDTVETNIHRFHEYFSEDDQHTSFYLEGVGTRFWIFGRGLGGAFGLGGKKRIREMYRVLCVESAKGDDEIDVIGFSRGAAMAVHFCNIINEYGVADISNGHFWPRWSRQLGWSRFRKATEPGPQIRFLGLFDEVASFGIAVKPLRNVSPTWKFASIPENVERSFHAMALDEVRRTFELVRPRRATHKDRHYEVWFRGVHSNVGGGYEDRGLSDIALTWMMEMAVWTWKRGGGSPPSGIDRALNQYGPLTRSGPRTKGPASHEPLEPDVDGEIGRQRSMSTDAWRELPDSPNVHHSVLLRSSEIATDHRSDNRRLARRVPSDRVEVFDPPQFHSPTPYAKAVEQARTSFFLIPWNPQHWLRRGEGFVFRSDHWIAIGSQDARYAPRDREIQIAFQAYVEVISTWLGDGCKSDFEFTGELRSWEPGGTQYEEMPPMDRVHDIQSVVDTSLYVYKELEQLGQVERRPS